MKVVNEAEFLRRNDLIANGRVRKVLKYFILSGPLIALGTYLKVFETEYLYCLLIWIIAIVEYGTLHYLGRCEENYNKEKYFGLIAVEILIGIMATQKSIGIHLSYGLIPLLSCMYIDVRLTRNISIFSYIVMIISLYFRSYGATAIDYPTLTPMEWFISQSLGFSIEFAFFTLGTCTIAVYLKSILTNCYQIGKENFYFSEAGKVKNAFLANISEELKTPLDEVSRVSELLLNQECMNEEMKQKIAHIAQKNEVLYTILDDIKDFSKLQLDKVEIIEEKYHFTELISDIADTMMSRIGDKSIDLNVVVNPSIPDELYGDRLRIRQILINLLNNTVKYIEDGFIILRIDWKRRESLAILNIEVMDTGYGIEEEDINRLFDSFCKLEHDTESTMEGIGLGLPICKKLCEMMGGKIAVRNGYGQGSLFTVTLPQKIASEDRVYGDHMWKHP